MGTRRKYGTSVPAPTRSVAMLIACSLTGGWTPGVFAQEGVIEEIVVTGFRSSLRESLAVKRSEAGFVDAISAEDIADFPDLNLAESIQRVPGVSIDRVNGEGRRITIRGLPADFNRIRINGMEAMNTTGSADSSGGANRGRGFDFNTFASDLFSAIVVRKTPSASLEEGSLGATVDLRTARPFDYDRGLTIAGLAQGGWNDQADEVNPRVSGLISATNEAGTFGGLVSVAYSDRTIQEEGFSTVRWQDGTFGSVGGVDCVADPADPGCAAIDGDSGVYHPRIPRYGRLSHDQERLGMTGSLAFRPTDRTDISLDVLYSEFDTTRDEEYLEVFFRSQEGDIDVVDFTIDAGRNIMDSGAFNMTPLDNGTHPVRSEHRFDELNTDFTQFTLTIDHDFTDELRGSFFAGTSDSKFDNPVQTTILYDAIVPVNGYRYDFRGDSETPLVDFGSLDVTDPSQFAFTEFRDRPQSVDNTFDTLSASLEYQLNDQLAVSGGLSWKEFTFDTHEVRRENTNGSRVCDAGVFDCDPDGDGINELRGVPLTPDLLDNLSGFGSGLGAPSGVDRGWVSADVDAAAALVGLYGIPGTIQAGNVRSVKEEDTGAWVQLDFESRLGEVPVRGNFGVRYVETETTSTGQVNGSDVTVGRKYDDTLPSANVVFEFRDDLLVRAAAAKVMTRPSLGNLTPGGSLDSFNGPPFEFDAGNPGLDPFRANSFDLAVEWYFADEALLSVGGFYKDAESFFTTGATDIVPYSQTGLPISLAPASSPLRVALDAGQDPQVELSQVQNGGDASLNGFEVIYQQPFTFLPGIGQNFGFAGNYTYVDSDEIIGFSPNAFNATLYFEDNRLSARLSAAYRDAYQTREANDDGRDERGVDSTFNLDFALSYQWSETVDLTFEAINLTDEYEHQIFDSADLVNVYHHTGREFLFGVRWTM